MSQAVLSQANSDEQLQYCGFLLGKDLFAVSVQEVQEVIRPQKVTPVPRSNPVIKGLINLRGQIVTLIDLRKLMGMEQRDSEDYMNVIVRANDFLIALMVDEIRDVIDVTRVSYEKTPNTVDEDISRYVDGVHKLKDNLLIVLNLNQIFNYLS